MRGRIVLAWQVKVGDCLVWDETVTSARPAEVVQIGAVDEEGMVEITYINRNGRETAYNY